MISSSCRAKPFRFSLELQFNKYIPCPLLNLQLKYAFKTAEDWVQTHNLNCINIIADHKYNKVLLSVSPCAYPRNKRRHLVKPQGKIFTQAQFYLLISLLNDYSNIVRIINNRKWGRLPFYGASTLRSWSAKINCVQ